MSLYLNKQEIAQQLKDFGIQGSIDAGKLRRWVVENQQKICPESICQISDSNHYDNDHTRVYILRLIEKVEVEVLRPVWSFLWLTSSNKVLTKTKINLVLLTIQLGSTDGDFLSSRFPPIVTSESGLFVY